MTQIKNSKQKRVALRFKDFYLSNVENLHQFLDHLSFRKTDAEPDYEPINNLVERRKQILYLDFDLLLKF
jgi:hypothetical protein